MEGNLEREQNCWGGLYCHHSTQWGLLLLTAWNKSYLIPELRLKKASPCKVDPAQEIKSFFLAGSWSACVLLPYTAGEGRWFLECTWHFFPLHGVLAARYLGRLRNRGASGWSSHPAWGARGPGWISAFLWATISSRCNEKQCRIRSAGAFWTHPVLQVTSCATFCPVAPLKAGWVTGSSTGTTRENSGRVHTLSASAHTDTAWSGNTTYMWATSFHQYTKDIGCIELDQLFFLECIIQDCYLMKETMLASCLYTEVFHNLKKVDMLTFSSHC